MKVPDRRSNWSMGIVLGTLAVADATAMEFEPKITLGVSYTDNLTLASEDEQDEVVYLAEPAFSLTHETERIDLNADYQLQAYRYRDLKEDQVWHQYDASMELALVPDALFFEVGGSRNQSIRDPELQIPNSNPPLSGNLQDRDEYYYMPSFQLPLGSNVIARGSYRNSWVDYSEGDFAGFSGDAENRDADFTMDNYRRGRGLTWALRYNWQRSIYDEYPPWEYQEAAAELGFWLGSSLRLFGTGGRESAWDDPLNPELTDPFWEAGFAYGNGERLNLEFAAGERTFGSSWRGSVDFNFRRGSLNLSYAETPTTQSFNQYRMFELQDADSFEDFLSRPGSAERFISKSMQASLSIELSRSSLTFAAFNTDRSDRTSASGDALPDETQRGVNVAFSYQLGAKTDLRAGASWAEREFGPNDGPRVLIRGTLAADHRLGARTTLSLEYEYAEEDPKDGGSGLDYVANTATLLLMRTF
jgi:hypothetical protein